MNELLMHQQLLKEWEATEADLEAVRRFSKAGGNARIHVTCAGDPEAAAVINRLFATSGGFDKIIAHALHHADKHRNTAKAMVIGQAVAA